MKTSPFAPWTDAASDAPAASEVPGNSTEASAGLLQQAAQQLADAASRLASLEPPGADSSNLGIQITVTTPLGEPLPFTSDVGPDLTLLS